MYTSVLLPASSHVQLFNTACWATSWIRSGRYFSTHGSPQGIQRSDLFFSKLFNNVQHKPVQQAWHVSLSWVGRRVPSPRGSESNRTNTPKVLPKIKETNVKLSCKKHVRQELFPSSFSQSQTLANASFGKHQEAVERSLQPHKHSFCLS